MKNFAAKIHNIYNFVPMKTDFSTIYEGLNSAQSQAVEQFDGPCLIVAGAGSGKTRVLTCRIANILDHGHKAGSVLALTFTNKASKEMKERIASLVGYDVARNLWMGTFHSVFVKFLREDAELLGFPKSFTIYDTSDSRSAIRACVKELSLDEKIYKPNEVLSRISMAKNNLVTPAAYLSNATLAQNDAAAKKPRIGDIYALYHKKCKQAGAMDFDDILVYTNILLRDFPQVLEKLRSRFSYILVDEYQDTNYSQYLIVKKLASEHRNLCVVGDDAQSIYSFRGARIENILNFRKDYPEAKEFRLEQNYRSTQTIVKAANSLIARNSMQIKKECFSSAAEGEKISVMNAYTDQEEAFMLASSVLARIYQDKASYGDFAVLYRTNAQSRAVEEALRKRSLPYKIYGGHSFYERAEVKDMISYLRLLLNKKDDEAFRRIVNVPPRGIGDTTVSCLTAAANSAGVSLWEAMMEGQMSAMGIKQAAAGKLFQFAKMIAEISAKVTTYNVYDIAMEVLVKSGYMDYLRSDTSVEGQARLDNVEELMNSIKAFVEEVEETGEINNDLETAKSETAKLESAKLESTKLESTKNEFTKQESGNSLSNKLKADSDYSITVNSNSPTADSNPSTLPSNSSNSDSNHLTSDLHSSTSPFNDLTSDLHSSTSPFNDDSNLNVQVPDGHTGNSNPLVSLSNYIENIALLSAIDENNTPEDSNKISLMTVHSAKGLEFPYVYVVGMEENLFPSGSMSGIKENELEEERRLFYVALTRAKLNVTLSYAQSRFRWGSHVNYPTSRFLREIDPKYLDWPDMKNEMGGDECNLVSMSSLANSGASGSDTRFRDKSGSGNYDRSGSGNYDRSGSGNYNRSGSGSYDKSTSGSYNRSGFGTSDRFSSGAHDKSAPGTWNNTSGPQYRDRTGNPSNNKNSSDSARNVFRPSATFRKPADPDFKADPISKLKVGLKVEHDRFGFGTLLELEGDALNAKAIVEFEQGGKKTLLLKFAKLRVVE